MITVPECKKSRYGEGEDDVVRVAQALGAKAAKSRSRKSKGLSGAVVVKVLK